MLENLFDTFYVICILVLMSKNESIRALGLNRREEKLFFSLTETSQGVANLTRKTRLPRMTVYKILLRLRRRALVQSVCVGKRLAWRRSSDRELFGLYQSLMDTIAVHEHGGGKVSVVGTKGGEFVLHRGIKNLRTLYEKFVDSTLGNRFFAIQPNRSLANYNKIGGETLHKLNAQLKKSGTIAEAIGQTNIINHYQELLRGQKENAREFFEPLADRPYNVHLVPPEFLAQDAELYIFGNTALITNWTEEVAIEIKNPEVISFLKNFFELLKTVGTKTDLNALIKTEIVDTTKISAGEAG